MVLIKRETVEEDASATELSALRARNAKLERRLARQTEHLVWKNRRIAAKNEELRR